MRGDFDEDPDFEPEWEADDENVCADCGRFHSCEDQCGVCGAPLCFGCFEMGCGVCKGTHKGDK